MKQDELLKSYVKVTEDGVEGSAQAVSEFFRLAQVEEDTHEDEKEESVGFEKGDKVRLTLNGKENARFGLSTVKDGDVGKVIRVREYDYDDTVIDVEFPTHDDWTADPSELTKITDEEFAIIERKDEKERKQGRFAIGDIVYYEDDVWFEGEGYGEVIGFGDLSGEPRVKAVSNFGIECRYVINSENLTLVCKAENREDK